MSLKLFALCAFAAHFVLSGYVYEEELFYDSFPSGFRWGVSTAAYQVGQQWYWSLYFDRFFHQIEGGWDLDGKGVSIWDTFTNETSNIDDGSDGNVACDSYHKYKEDVQLLSKMSMNSYRFSIAWTRIIPRGEVKF